MELKNRDFERELEVQIVPESEDLEFSIASETPYRRIIDGQPVDEILVISDQSINKERFEDR